jgi:hypothetical protein
VVARAGRDDAALRLLRSQQEKAVESAAFLERTGHLEIVELEKNAVASEPAHGFRVSARGKINPAANPLARRRDVIEGDLGAFRTIACGGASFIFPAIRNPGPILPTPKSARFLVLRIVP